MEERFKKEREYSKNRQKRSTNLYKIIKLNNKSKKLLINLYSMLYNELAKTIKGLVHFPNVSEDI